ncbi:MAG TPA: NADH-quinone oxidoreductase subunit NuoN [Actinomycetota bacterium]|nr:NADH-quinone oxidoreductase subunit NuoN [Actinomycetota bacterium]
MPQPPDIVFSPILPELILAVAGMAVLLIDAAWPRRDQRVAVGLTLAGLAGAALASIRLWGIAERFVSERAAQAAGQTGVDVTVLGGMVAVDQYGAFFRLVILAAAATAALLSFHYLERTGEGRGEYYALLLFATSGMTLITVAADLLMVFIALEVLSLSLYVMAGFSPRRPASQEAGLKYFLLGAFSSAFFLYGIALAYGAAGTTSLSGIAGEIGGETGSVALAMAAAGLLTVGFAFKVAAVPFHMWTPDVYQGAPTSVTAFMAAGTKVAGFAALIRVASVALGGLGWELTPILYGIAAVTMVVGSVLAIAQQDVKRMLAYSSIAHAGFVLVGVAAANQQGISGAMFYLVAYAAMILGAFAVVVVVSRRGEERTSLASYRGLARQSPGVAALLALFLLSLAGIPPTAGFIAKVLVFQAAVDAGLASLVVIAVLASVIAAFFYLRLIVLSYMYEPEEEVPLRTAPAPAVALAAMAAATLAFGVFPSLLLDVLRTAAILRW